MKKHITIFIIALFCSATAFSQTGGFYSFNELYGFKTKEVYNILQDKKGMIWIASANGVFSFDGTNFVNYFHPDYDKEASNISEDANGRIWYTNFSGQIFYIDTDGCHLFGDYSKDMTGFISYTVDRFPQVDILTSNVIRSKKFHSGKEEILTISEENFNIIKQARVPYNHSLLVLNDELHTSFTCRKKGALQTQMSVAKLSGSHFLPCVAKEQSNIRGIVKLLSYKNDLYFIDYGSYKRDLYRVQECNIEHVLSFHATSGLFPRSVRFLDSGQFFVAESNEVSMYNLQTKKKTSIPYLSDKNISQLMIDKEGNHWYTSTTDGIIIRINDVLDSKKIANERLMVSAFHPNGTVYALKRNGDFLSVSPDQTVSLRKKILSTMPYSMTYNPFGRQVIFTGSNTMLSVNGAGLPIKKTYKSNSMGFKKSAFINADYGIFSASNGAILHRNNLNQSTPKVIAKSKMEFYSTKDTIPRKYMTLRAIRCMNLALETKTQDAYVDHIDGLYVYGNYSSNEVRHKQKTIICNQLIADASKGIWAVDNQNNILRIIDRRVIRSEKLQEEVEYMAQWENYLFLANENVIIKYDTLTKKTIRIDYADGLPKEGLLNIHVFGDKLRVLTETHVTDIPCQYNYINKVPPTTFIHRIKIYDDTVKLSDRYELNHTKNNIEISFSALSIRSQNQFTYQYRMRGVSDDWITNTSAVPFARFLKLEAGKYTFELRSCNEDGVCSKLKQIQFVISPVFYKTWWFILLSILSFILLAIWATRYWFKTKEKEQKLEQEKDILEKEVFKSKISAIRSQMNPHFMFNALNTIQEFIMTNQKSIASDYLADFADLMRMYLLQSKADTIMLNEEIDTLNLYLKLEKLRFEENFEFEVVVSPKIEMDKAKIPVMLLQPFVENAIKHGLLHKKGEQILELNFDFKENNILVSIRDNGIGREKSQEINKNRKGHESFATSAIEERINIYNQTRDSAEQITVRIIDLNNPIGTLVEIVVPQ